ncbi:DUF2846 domain-containing protein, partial [Candidatus Parcubacteria bacterium]
MKRLLLFACLSALLGLTGCASVPKESDYSKVAHIKAFPPPGTNKAGLYIFRDSYLGSALKKDIWVDNDCVGESAPNTFFYVTVAGNKRHTIATESEFSPNTLSILTQSGKNYFVRQYIKMGVFVGGADLEVVPENEAKPIIQRLDLATPG